MPAGMETPTVYLEVVPAMAEAMAEDIISKRVAIRSQGVKQL
jgi:hypothetical protein